MKKERHLPLKRKATETTKAMTTIQSDVEESRSITRVSNKDQTRKKENKTLNISKYDVNSSSIKNVKCIINILQLNTIGTIHQNFTFGTKVLANDYKTIDSWNNYLTFPLFVNM